MERPFVVENAKERKRLSAVVNQLTDEELMLILYKEGWTIAVALAHLAFWDQWSLTQMQKWKKTGVSPENIDSNAVNDTLLSIFLEMPPRKAANLAISSAESIDKELEEAPDALIIEMEKLAHKARLYRCNHRKLHLDEIEALLSKREK